MSDSDPMATSQFAGHTDIAGRKHNEDAFLIDPDRGLLVVADGVGGHHAGEVASAKAIEVIHREISAGNDLAGAMQLANAEIKEDVASGAGKAGMATTVVAALIDGDDYEIAWVGDSRAYLWDGRLTLLTRDHSFVEEQLAAGEITLETARTHPRRHVILQAIGLQNEDNLRVGSNRGQLGAGNTLLLCSDGVSDPLGNDSLARLLGNPSTNADQIGVNLIKAAMRAGGTDNATAVVLKHKPDDDLAAGTSDTMTWAYHPDTNQYDGLPDVTPRLADSARELEETQVVKSQEPAGHIGQVKGSADASGRPDGGNKTRRVLLAVVLGVAIALLVGVLLR